MRRLSIGHIGGLLLMCAVLASCSKDKPTANPPVPNQKASALVGTWERTTTKADGVVIMPANDQWNVYDEDVIILKADGTGSATDKFGAYEILNWSTDGESLSLSVEGLGLVEMAYTVQDDTLTTFFPSENEINPDLEFTYTRQ